VWFKSKGNEKSKNDMSSVCYCCALFHGRLGLENRRSLTFEIAETSHCKHMNMLCNISISTKTIFLLISLLFFLIFRNFYAMFFFKVNIYKSKTLLNTVVIILQ